MSSRILPGATFLPSGKDSQGRKLAHKGKGGASPVFGALELGMRAQAMVQSANEAPKSRAEEPSEASEVFMTDLFHTSCSWLCYESSCARKLLC